MSGGKNSGEISTNNKSNQNQTGENISWLGTAREHKAEYSISLKVNVVLLLGL